jgi:hypothetical protein
LYSANNPRGEKKVRREWNAIAHELAQLANRTVRRDIAPQRCVRSYSECIVTLNRTEIYSHSFLGKKSTRRDLFL